MGYPETLAGRALGEYQIEQLLGQSQLGSAYLALQPAQNRRVMLTLFPMPEGMSTQEYERFQRHITQEGEVLTHLTHPHILPVYACGTQPGYSYLVTAFVKEASLSQLLRENARFSPQQVLPMLKQLASALDYAHGQGIVHGMLGLSNVIVSEDLHVRIAGFGLRSMLEIYGGNVNTQPSRPLAHLTSLHGVFLANPESISPERVLGMTIDARADVFALGVMLFTLLSGNQPFKGSEPLEIALQRLQQTVPSLHASCPDVPAAFDLVIDKMLECEPTRRTPHAGDAALAFERTVKTFNVSQTPGVGTSHANAWMQEAQITIPPTVNWFDEEIIPANTWQAGTPAETRAPSTQGLFAGTGQTSALAPTGSVPQVNNGPASLGGTNPFLWWSSASTGFQAPAATPGSFASRPLLGLNTAKGRRRPQPGLQDRRNLAKLIVTGGVAAGVVAIGGISLARIAQSQKGTPSQLANISRAGSTTTPGSTPGAAGTLPASSTPTSQPTSAPGSQPSPTAPPKPTATRPPSPKPTPTPGRTGTVIGHTSQATNSVVSFTNPADGSASLLIRLSNGSFVACERACTHQGVAVDYDSGSQHLHCPAHDAYFDPTNGFRELSGSGPSGLSPLPKVTIRVNGDGTITTG